MNKYLMVALAAALIALFFTNQARVREKEDKENVQGKYTYLTQTYTTLTNKYGQVVTEQKVAQTNSEAEIKKLSAEVFDLTKREERRVKEVQALIRLSQEVRIDSIDVPYIVKDTVYSVSDSMVNRKDVVVPPQPFEITKKDSFSIKGTVLKEGVRINSISIADTVSMRIVEQKKGLFKPRNIVVQSIHSNALVKTNGVNSITLKQKPSAWQRWIKPVLFATAAGVITYKVAR